MGEQSYTRSSDEPRAHAATLLPMVDDLLREQALAPSQIDALAVGAGPGSFTGLRIAMSVAQGLAFGWQKPLIPVNSLQAMAYAVKSTSRSQRVVCALDARMNELYLAVYDLQGELPEAVLPPQLCAYDQYAEALVAELSRLDAAVGLGLQCIDGELLTGLGHVDMQLNPSACAVAQLAQRLGEAAACEPDSVEPIYLRNSVAWAKRQPVRKPQD